MRYYPSQSDNPPFPLEREQLGAVMNSKELTDSIREKIDLTLKLDTRYKLLACCIAWYYLTDDAHSATGCSVEEIQEVAEGYNMRALADLDRAGFLNYLEELEQMGILISDQDGERFHFRRNMFKNVVGISEEALEENIRVLNQNGGDGIGMGR